MFNGNMSPSLADIAAVTKENDGFGGNNGWWILIILFAIFGGWGNNNRNGGNCATQEEVRAAVDQQTLLSKIDRQVYGLADLGYAINTNFAAAELSRSNNQASNISSFAQVRYDLASDTCALTNAINQATQNIIQNDNSNYRQLHDEIFGLQLENLKTQIAQKDQQIFQLELKASQCDQNNYIVNQLRQTPVPAYVVANPYASTSCSNGNCF